MPLRLDDLHRYDVLTPAQLQEVIPQLGRTSIYKLVAALGAKIPGDAKRWVVKTTRFLEWLDGRQPVIDGVLVKPPATATPATTASENQSTCAKAPDEK
jgi:hypothetical protein